MSLTITSDPLISLADAKSLFADSDEQQLIAMLNGLAAKFLAFTNRVQIKASETVAIVDYVQPLDGSKIWLRASPILLEDSQQQALEFKIEHFDGQTEQSEWTHADGELVIVSHSEQASVAAVGFSFPECSPDEHLKLTYYGGWSTLPGDIMQGAIMQGQLDLQRMSGVVGMRSRSQQGESTQFEQSDLCVQARQLWQKYRVM